jgi:hypothetical protein
MEIIEKENEFSVLIQLLNHGLPTFCLYCLLSKKKFKLKMEKEKENININ